MEPPIPEPFKSMGIKLYSYNIYMKTYRGFAYTEFITQTVFIFPGKLNICCMDQQQDML